jgi:hypothetical protein
MEDKQKKNSNIYTITDPLLEPYYIQFDQFCFTAVKKVKAGNSDRVRDYTVGYYSSVESCLDSIAKDSIKTQNYTSLKDFITAYKTRIEEIKQVKLS